ncbi:hypothetical protein Hanom_Chr08g00716501 [Helianthus anomalus]
MEKKKDKSPAKRKDHSSTPVSAEQQPPISSTYEAIGEDSPTSSEAIVIQDTPQATTNEAAQPPLETTAAEVILEQPTPDPTIEGATSNPTTTTEE